MADDAATREMFIAEMIQELARQQSESEEVFNNPRKRSATDIFRTLCFDFPLVDRSELIQLSTELGVFFSAGAQRQRGGIASFDMAFNFNFTFLENIAHYSFQDRSSSTEGKDDDATNAAYRSIHATISCRSHIYLLNCSKNALARILNAIENDNPEEKASASSWLDLIRRYKEFALRCSAVPVCGLSTMDAMGNRGSSFVDGNAVRDTTLASDANRGVSGVRLDHSAAAAEVCKELEDLVTAIGLLVHVQSLREHRITPRSTAPSKAQDKTLLMALGSLLSYAPSTVTPIGGTADTDLENPTVAKHTTDARLSAAYSEAAETVTQVVVHLVFLFRDMVLQNLPALDTAAGKRCLSSFVHTLSSASPSSRSSSLSITSIGGNGSSISTIENLLVSTLANICSECCPLSPSSSSSAARASAGEKEAAAVLKAARSTLRWVLLNDGALHKIVDIATRMSSPSLAITISASAGTAAPGVEAGAIKQGQQRMQGTTALLCSAVGLGCLIDIATLTVFDRLPVRIQITAPPPFAANNSNNNSSTTTAVVPVFLPSSAPENALFTSRAVAVLAQALLSAMQQEVQRMCSLMNETTLEGTDGADRDAECVSSSALSPAHALTPRLLNFFSMAAMQQQVSMSACSTVPADQSSSSSTSSNSGSSSSSSSAGRAQKTARVAAAAASVAAWESSGLGAALCDYLLRYPGWQQAVRSLHDDCWAPLLAHAERILCCAHLASSTTAEGDATDSSSSSNHGIGAAIYSKHEPELEQTAKPFWTTLFSKRASGEPLPPGLQHSLALTSALTVFPEQAAGMLLALSLHSAAHPHPAPVLRLSSASLNSNNRSNDSTNSNSTWMLETRTAAALTALRVFASTCEWDSPGVENPDINVHRDGEEDSLPPAPTTSAAPPSISPLTPSLTTTPPPTKSTTSTAKPTTTAIATDLRTQKRLRAAAVSPRALLWSLAVRFGEESGAPLLRSWSAAAAAVVNTAESEVPATSRHPTPISTTITPTTSSSSVGTAFSVTAHTLQDEIAFLSDMIVSLGTGATNIGTKSATSGSAFTRAVVDSKNTGKKLKAGGDSSDSSSSDSDGENGAVGSSSCREKGGVRVQELVLDDQRDSRLGNTRENDAAYREGREGSASSAYAILQQQVPQLTRTMKVLGAILERRESSKVD